MKPAAMGEKIVNRWVADNIVATLMVALTLLGVLGGQVQGAENATAPIPLIYCTDLFHPHDDPDDHFDLAAIYSMSQIDLQLIVLDQGARQAEKPGRIPVMQMNAITGRSVPAVTGLSDPLRHPKDTGLDQPAQHQRGVERMIATLERSPGKMVIVTVGSVRDLMAAYNRRPELLREKVSSVFAFIGEASDPAFQEYNVGLDVQAYVALMRSDLPLHWVPCFDGGLWQNNGRASYWKAPHRELLAEVADPVRNYFIYALTIQRSDPMAFLAQPIDPELEARVLGMTRNLWCCAVFVAVRDGVIVREGESYTAIPRSRLEGRTPVFDFERVQVVVSDEGVVTEVKAGGRPIQRFRVLDRENYARAMTEVTSRMLRDIRCVPDLGREAPSPSPADSSEANAR
jgi:hypothetical protein